MTNVIAQSTTSANANATIAMVNEFMNVMPAVSSSEGNITVTTRTVSETAKAADLAFTSMQKTLEQLTHKREAWEQGAYRTANQYLYQLLAECYAFYKSMEGATDAAKAKRQALKDYCVFRNFKFNDSTHSINRIVACVFGVDRRRVSAYATALRKALNNKVEPKNLVDFFFNAGGLEEVRTNKSPTALTVNDKAAIASKRISAKKLGTVQSEELKQQLDAAKIGANTVLLGTWNADGSIDVRAVVDGTGVLNAALASYYSADKAAREKAEIEQQQSTIQQQKLDAAQAAADQALVA